MKKIQLADEAGRAMAQKRYGSFGIKSNYGHSQMAHNVKGKFQFAAGGAAADPPGYKEPNPMLSDINIDEEGTDAYYVKQEEKEGVPESQRHYGDPDPVRPRRGRPLIPKKALGGPASKKPGTGIFPGESEQEREEVDKSRLRRQKSQPFGAGTTFGAQWSGGERERGIESGFKRGGKTKRK